MCVLLICTFIEICTHVTPVDVHSARHHCFMKTRQSEMADRARRATRDLSQFHMGVRTSTPFDLGNYDAYTKSCRYYIPLHFDTNPESLRPFVPEIWPNNVFNLSATYVLFLPKILKIFVSHGVPIRNMYAKFHNDRLRNG